VKQGGADVLLVTWAGGGNVNPLLALGMRLRGRGHRVRALGPAERDQPGNASAVAVLGAGRTLASEASVTEVRDAIVALLEDEGTAAAASACAERLRALGSGLRAVTATEALLS
jgi:UDP:flavonoid glycosyltransferase YjiC (YdhE family)